MNQLTRLAKPLDPRLIEKAPQGKYGDYCAHHNINQALLAVLGPFDLEVVEILRGYVPAKTFKKGQAGEYVKAALDNAIQGAVIRLTCEIDGRLTRIEEAGDCEDPQNWDTDGARLKDCISDGLKRCAMRIGLGLGLWAQEHAFLYESLSRREQEQEASLTQGASGVGVDGSATPTPRRHGAARDFAAIFAVAKQVCDPDTAESKLKDKVKELARIEGILAPDGSLKDLDPLRRGQLLRLLHGMQEEQIGVEELTDAP